MFQVTVDSTACLLLNEAPDLAAAAYILRKKRKWVSEIGRTALEERRAFVESDVASVAYTIFAEGAEGGALRRALRDYDMRPVLVPFWPGAGLLSEISASRWSSGLRVFFEPDWSAFEIRTDGAAAPTSFTPSDDCAFAPLLWCAFETLPKPRAVSGALMEVALELVETGLAAYALDPSAGSVLFGPSVGTTLRLILPSCVEWSSLPKVGGVDYLYERTSLGYVRQPVDKYAPQVARRRLDVHLAYDADDLARLLRLWMHSDGPVNSWWCEGAYAETVLVADTSAASIEIEVEDASVFDGEDYLCFVGSDGRLTGRRIVSIAGNILTLDSAPGVFNAATTRLTPLLMVRFVKEVLRIDWKRGWAIAEIDAELIELPTETEPGLPGGESLGGTLGPQVKHRYAYLITDGGRTWRYTSSDRPLDLGTLGIFEPRPIEHGEITQELNLEQHDCDLTVGWWEGNPFFEAQVDDAAPPLTVTIYEHTDDGVSAPVAIFTGQASLSYADDICQATLRGPEAILDTKIPVQVTSPRCWAPLYGVKCGLSRSSLAVLCDVDSVSLASRSISVRRSGAAVYGALPAGYYAGGYAERSTLGSVPRRYPVISSSTSTPSSMLSLSLLGYAPPPEGSLSVVRRYTDNYQVGGFVADAAGNFYVRDDGSTAHRIFRFDPIAGPRQVYLDDGWLSYGMDFDSAGYLYIGDYSTGIVRRVAPGGQSYSDYTSIPLPVDIVFAGGDVSYVLSEQGLLRMVSAGVDVWTRQLDFSPDTARRLTWANGLLYIGAGRAIYTYDPATSQLTTLARDLPKPVQDLAVMPDGAVYFTVDYPHNMPLYELIDGQPSPVNSVSGILRDLQVLPSGRLAIGCRYAWISTLCVSLDVLTLYPGCDKSWARCQALGNSANFRGFPHMPKTNPAMVAVSNTTGSGSKK